MPDGNDRDRRDDRKKKPPRPLGPRREPGRPGAGSDDREKSPAGGGRRRNRGREAARPGDRKGPRPARDISAASAVGPRREEEGEDRDSKGRKRGRPPRPARKEGSRPAPTPATTPSGDLTQVVQVMFKGVRTEYYTFRGDTGLGENEFVIVEADRGQDLGWVKRAEDAASLSCDSGCEHDHEHRPPVTLPARKILRRAAPVDVERRQRLLDEEPEVRRRTRELVARHELRMKISEAEWQWDRNKLTVYFTAEKRVDFRGLVKDMARTFKTRIELRQIGVRDEAKRLGGIGRCGRELCCRLWLPRIEPVTLQLAKDQGLSLNPAQISGACGRLMSCLHYEHEAYVQARKRFPRVGKILRTSRGEEKVTGWDLFRDTVALRSDEGVERTIPLDELKAETAGARGSKP
jgi:cell fate regulator YaaT (PSP1 superfamily)